MRASDAPSTPPFVSLNPEPNPHPDNLLSFYAYKVGPRRCPAGLVVSKDGLGARLVAQGRQINGIQSRVSGVQCYWSDRSKAEPLLLPGHIPGKSNSVCQSLSLPLSPSSPPTSRGPPVPRTHPAEQGAVPTPLSTSLNSLLHLVVWLVHWIAAACVICLIESIKPLLGSIVMIISFDLSSFPSSLPWIQRLILFALFGCCFFHLFSTLVEMFTQAFVFHPLSSLYIYPPSDRKTRPGSEIPNNGL